MRGFLAVAVAVVLIAGILAPSVAASESAPIAMAEQSRMLQLLYTPCLPQEVAQAEATASPGPDESASPAPEESASPAASASPAPSGSPAPSASPSAPPTPRAPLPIVPIGPGVLVAPPLPSTSPRVTPPPLPTPTPTASASPGPVYLAPVTPTPPPTPIPVRTAGPLQPAIPTPAVSEAPHPAETLGPNDYAVLGDTLTGSRTPGSPFDLDGNVNIIYQDGVLVGDHAHYDGTRYIDVTGHTLLRNRNGDTTLTADSIRFDTQTQRATAINGRGVTSQGVEQGRLHYTASQLVTERNGVTHGTHASLTTCENPRGGYHIESKTLDVIPNDRAVARSNVLYLGALAILYVPLLIIPLRHQPELERRTQGFVPLIGYSQAEGYYIKARIGFGTTPYYYGYYRVEAYTKIGFGLGYVGSIRRRDGKRSTDIDFFTVKNRTDNSQTYNGDINDQENFSSALRGTLRFSYQGDYGPLITLPPSLSLQLGLTRQVGKDTENYSFARQSTGSEASTNNYGFSDTYNFSAKLSNATTASYTESTFGEGGIASTSTNLHFNTDTHLSGNTYDYDLIIDRYDSSTPTGVDKLPELLIRPHSSIFPGLKAIPTTATFTVGEYSDPIADLATSRGQAQINFGPVLAHTAVGDLNASLNITQDAYGTGDAKAQVAQQINLTTPIGSSINNTLSYSNQHVNGLGNEPLTFDSIGGAYKNLQEILRIFNSNTYSLALTTGTAFNRQAQPVQYQLLTRPTASSSVVIGGNFTPGAGFGFDRTNVQLVTPIGRDSDIQFGTFVDWKNKGRLEDKILYYRTIIGDCYEVRVSYNEDLKTVNVTVDLLAFPSQALNFGLGQSSSIIPQSFATSQFTGG